MKHIRLQINDLIDQHGATFGDCPGCSICSDIKTLRNKLLQDPADRFAHILQKGEEMTKSDIAFLLDNEVTRKTIRKSLKMGSNEFFEMMKNFGMLKKKPKGDVEVAKITHEEYKDLKAKGLTDKVIAEGKGMAATYLSTLKKQWNANPESKVTEKPREEIKLLIDSIKDLPVNVLPIAEPVDKSAEYEALIKSLQEQLIDKGNIVLELQASLHEAQERIGHLSACCDDLEDELESVKAELAPIRQFAYLKLKQDIGA